jgi:nucleotidyltransferase substrate binding protein (TIGR01987 family)
MSIGQNGIAIGSVDLMTNKDIGWIQRLSQFSLAFTQLREAHEYSQKQELNKLEKLGLIQMFEFTHELAWKVLKDYIEFSGGQNLIGSKDTTREAFQKNLMVNGEAWMAMIASRNLTSHTYNESTAEEIVDAIINAYYPCFIDFEKKMKTLTK